MEKQNFVQNTNPNTESLALRANELYSRLSQADKEIIIRLIKSLLSEK